MAGQLVSNMTQMDFRQVHDECAGNIAKLWAAQGKAPRDASFSTVWNDQPDNKGVHFYSLSVLSEPWRIIWAESGVCENPDQAVQNLLGETRRMLEANTPLEALGALGRRQGGQVHKNWTDQEDELLIYLVRFSKMTMPEIAATLSPRTENACQKRHEELVASGRSAPLQTRFDRDEDRQLLTQYQKFGRQWSLIASTMPGRSGDACRMRFETLSKRS